MVNSSELRNKVIVTLLVASQAISGCTIPLESVRNFCVAGGVVLAIGAIGLYHWYNKQPQVKKYKEQKAIQKKEESLRVKEYRETNLQNNVNDVKIRDREIEDKVSRLLTERQKAGPSRKHEIDREISQLLGGKKYS